MAKIKRSASRVKVVAVPASLAVAGEPEPRLGTEPPVANLAPIVPQSSFSSLPGRLEYSFRTVVVNWSEKLPPLADGVFWNLVERYRDTVAYRLNLLGKLPEHHSTLSRQSAEFLFTEALDNEVVTLEGLGSFVAGYDRLVDQIKDGLEKLNTERHDDSHGDLCDALPLAGRAVCRKIIAGKYLPAAGVRDADARAMARLEGDVRKSACEAPGSSLLARWILDGENFLRMALRDTLLHRLLRLGARACEEDLCR